MIIWSIAGNDSGGGAGLSADLRMAEAFGAHLCPVVAAVTAQNSQGVSRIASVGLEMLDAQLSALERDMPPAVVKTGLLGDAAQIECVARWIDRLRERRDVALVVDPVLGATTGASFADARALEAMRRWLLPRATLLTPNRREAIALLGDGSPKAAASVPELARRLMSLGPASVCVTGGDAAAEELALDWMASAQASGWLAGPRMDTVHTHGTGCSFATAAACALALGFVPADALVLAKMATAHAIAHGRPAGQGAGPVVARSGFAQDPLRLPMLSWSESAEFAPMQRDSAPAWPSLGLYAIVDSAQRVQHVLDAGVRCVQLRIKRGDATVDALRDEIRHAARACDAARAQLFVNDHWQLAMELGVHGVHLGQEDLQALTDAERAQLRGGTVHLGISSHSLWELCRAASMSPRYIACGPVWPTLTKAMPWKPQGLDNLSWWCAMASAPVVAIGGILDPEQAQWAAQCGADGICVVRALGDDPSATVPLFAASVERGRQLASTNEATGAAPLHLPHPSLAG